MKARSFKTVTSVALKETFRERIGLSWRVLPPGNLSSREKGTSSKLWFRGLYRSPKGGRGGETTTERIRKERYYWFCCFYFPFAAWNVLKKVSSSLPSACLATSINIRSFLTPIEISGKAFII